MTNVVASISLKKKEKLSLRKVAPGLSRVRVAITWRAVQGQEVDLDLSGFMLNDKDRILTQQDFIYYGQEISPDGSVHYLGDNRKGSVDDGSGSLGDSEAIKVNLDDVPERVKRIVFAVTIDGADEKRQKFKHASEAVARLFNDVTGAEIARFPLEGDFKEDSAMLMVDLHREGDSWDFNPIGQGFKGHLGDICNSYGLDIGYN
ncbi:TerD family protein [Pseudomonas sp. PLMAX]|jgi:tellurium resistance protein TerD|uniref:TerD family protein n=1 Tax=Pseudomonas sp. PLMAX TaxID=2201998 RepID=UPI0038B76043